MSYKLLIVDDEKQVTDQFSGCARGKLEVLVANSASEAYALARANMPEIGTIDFGIGEANGNEVGKTLKSINPGIKLAGITSGDPNNFDSSIFDIRESKSIDNARYMTIIDCLRSPNPRAEYSRYKRLTMPCENLAALSILLLGYTVALNLQKGIQPVPGIKLVVPPEEQIALFLDVKKIGLDPDKLYEDVCFADPSLKDDKNATEFFEALKNGKFGEIPLNIAQYVENKLKKILGGKP